MKVVVSVEPIESDSAPETAPTDPPSRAAKRRLSLDKQGLLTGPFLNGPLFASSRLAPRNSRPADQEADLFPSLANSGILALYLDVQGRTVSW